MLANKSDLNQWTEIGCTSVRFSAPSPNGLKRLFHHSEVVAHAYIVPQFQGTGYQHESGTGKNYQGERTLKIQVRG